MSIRRLGLPMCWPACQITRPSASTNCCPGTGTGKTLPLKPRKARQTRPNRSTPWPSPDAYFGRIVVFGETSALLAQPGLQFGDQLPATLLAHAQAFLGCEAVDLALDGKQAID